MPGLILLLSSLLTVLLIFTAPLFLEPSFLTTTEFPRTACTWRYLSNPQQKWHPPSPQRYSQENLCGRAARVRLERPSDTQSPASHKPSPPSPRASWFPEPG